MCVVRSNKNTVNIPADSLRRLLDMEKNIRAAIDGADMERLFRAAYTDPHRGDYDIGLYEGNRLMAERVLSVLPKDLEF